MFSEAKQDCDAALTLEPVNKKAFYRRALANKGLKVSRATPRQVQLRADSDTGCVSEGLDGLKLLCCSLLQDYLACSSDLQELLQLDPTVQEAEKELEEVTVLLRQSLASSSQDKPRRVVPITEVLTPLHTAESGAPLADRNLQVLKMHTNLFLSCLRLAMRRTGQLPLTRVPPAQERTPPSTSNLPTPTTSASP